MTDLIAKKSLPCLLFAFSAAVFSGVTPMKRADAGVFLNPADNAYSTAKVFSRPWLQNRPVPQIWETDMKSDAFRDAFLDAFILHAPTLEQINTLSIQMDNEESLRDFRRITEENPSSEWAYLTGDLNEMIFVVKQAEENTVSDLAYQDNRYARFQAGLEQKNANRLPERLTLWEAFWKALPETAAADVAADYATDDMAVTEKRSFTAFKAIDEGDFSDQTLDAAQDINQWEMRETQEAQETEEVLMSLLIDDIIDMASGVSMAHSDEDALYGVRRRGAEQKVKVFSLLDRHGKKGQIYSSDPDVRRKALLERLNDFLTSDKVKDAK